MPNFDYTLAEYGDLAGQLMEMMVVGQEFYLLCNGKTHNVKLKKIKYRHGLSDDHVVYNLALPDFCTFFANGILCHNAIAKVQL